ncbi:hypothetical protein HK101_009454 [Irineochytrium annulatum]|nr:hypothetical protein HK101_009454 [Irineochytrium annulatum]
MPTSTWLGIRLGDDCEPNGNFGKPNNVVIGIERNDDVDIGKRRNAEVDFEIDLSAEELADSSCEEPDIRLDVEEDEDVLIINLASPTKKPSVAAPRGRASDAGDCSPARKRMSSANGLANAGRKRYKPTHPEKPYSSRFDSTASGNAPSSARVGSAAMSAAPSQFYDNNNSSTRTGHSWKPPKFNGAPILTDSGNSMPKGRRKFFNNRSNSPDVPDWLKNEAVPRKSKAPDWLRNEAVPKGANGRTAPAAPTAPQSAEGAAVLNPVFREGDLIYLWAVMNLGAYPRNINFTLKGEPVIFNVDGIDGVKVPWPAVIREVHADPSPLTETLTCAGVMFLDENGSLHHESNYFKSSPLAKPYLPAYLVEPFNRNGEQLLIVESMLSPFVNFEIPGWAAMSTKDEMRRNVEALAGTSIFKDGVLASYALAMVGAKEIAHDAFAVLGVRTNIKLKLDSGQTIDQYSYSKMQIGSVVIGIGDVIRVDKRGTTKVSADGFDGQFSPRAEVFSEANATESLPLPPAALDDFEKRGEMLVEVICIDWEDQTRPPRLLGIHSYVDDMEDHPDMVSLSRNRQLRNLYDRKRCSLPFRTPLPNFVDDGRDPNHETMLAKWRRLRMLVVRWDAVISRYNYDLFSEPVLNARGEKLSKMQRKSWPTEARQRTVYVRMSDPADIFRSVVYHA